MIQKRDFITFILLSIVTCGIYSIFFFIKYTEDLNIICEGDGNRTKDYIVVFLLSIVTCGIYQLYWMYQVGNRLQDNAPRYDKSFSENGTTLLICALLSSITFGLSGLYGQYIMVNNFNKLAEAYNERH